MLGYRFTDRALLNRALTHRSCGRDNNERLEYLGDGILGFIIADALFTRFPRASEGELTRMRSQLVRKKTLADMARKLGLNHCLQFGGGAIKGGVGDHDSVFADGFEAVIGAIYLDSDLATVKTVLIGLFAEQLRQVALNEHKDNKTRLQEFLQKHGMPLPVYEIVAQSGEAHAKTFTVACIIETLPEITATGGNRRTAEQDAASKALALLHAHS